MITFSSAKRISHEAYEIVLDFAGEARTYTWRATKTSGDRIGVISAPWDDVSRDFSSYWDEDLKQAPTSENQCFIGRCVTAVIQDLEAGRPVMLPMRITPEEWTWDRVRQRWHELQSPAEPPRPARDCDTQ
jgi:hypothetical protein